MFSSNSSAPQSSPPKNTTPPSAATPPSPDDSSSPPAPNSSTSSPPPAPSKSHAAAPVSPAGIQAPQNRPSRGTGDSSSSSQKSVHRVSAAEIIFAAAGAAALLALLVAACVCCSRRTAPRRRRKPHSPMHSYADTTTSGHKGKSTYYTSGPQPQWQSNTGAGPSTSTSGPAGGSLHVPPDMNSGVPSGQALPPPARAARHQALGLGKGTFTYDELSAATGDFSQANLLGQGGFGYVHKGVLPSGKPVAVKQLKSGSGQGEREFQAEVDIISRVHHRHLVSLVGYCVAGASRMLVYEFVPNMTVEFHLHGKGLPPMTWATRLHIALGSARGLAYLHEDCQPRIIHRDIKSANILLDDNFEAMVADFGLAKLLASDDSTHVSTRVMGTFGYLAPEYASSGKLTEKSDVFSYGVVLLELLTGRRPVDAAAAPSFLEDGLVDWARPALSRALAGGDYDALADPRLEGNYDLVEMARVAASAAACVRQSAKKRPKMSQIVRALEGDMSIEDLNEGVRPGQSMLFGEAGPSG
ncbi:unnamed protein product [Alopecurus aequalis]